MTRKREAPGVARRYDVAATAVGLARRGGARLYLFAYAGRELVDPDVFA
jgi:hypothetical protein